MKIQLSSIEQAPKSLPIWHAILDDLCNPPPWRVAKVLGVSLRSVYRWNASGIAPRSACLALFWLTTWGRSQIDCQATNDARLAVGYANSLKGELNRLHVEVANLRRLGTFGSANDPGRPLTTLRKPSYDRIR